jgi:hypothetical protein
MHVLNAIDKQALRASQIQQKIKETGKATLATNGEPVKPVRIIDANLTEAESTAEASEPFPLNERQKNVNNGSARNDGQSGFAEYDRGFKDGREHACSLLKSIGLFEFEPRMETESPGLDKRLRRTRSKPSNCYLTGEPRSTKSHH